MHSLGDSALGLQRAMIADTFPEGASLLMYEVSICCGTSSPEYS